MNSLRRQSIWVSAKEDSDPMQLSLGDGLADMARRYPDLEAVVYACQPGLQEVRWSFAELDDRSNRLAAAILASGYHPGDRIAVWGPNHPHWILLEYALAKAGIIIVALNPLYKRAELLHTLNAAGVVAIFHVENVGGTNLGALLDQITPEVPTLKGRYTFVDGVAALLAAAPAGAVLPRVSPDNVLMVQYTSGTTGVPKAAMLSHRAVGTVARNSYRCWGFGAGDRICHGFPLFHVGGSGNSTPGAMLVGAATLPVYIFKAPQVLDILEQEKCTAFIGVPTMLTAMLADPSLAGRDFSALRLIVLGGSPVPPKLLHACEAAFGADICNSYGQTETSGVSTSTRAEDQVELKTQTSGKPLPGVSLKITNPEGSIVDCGVAGELCYDGPGNMLGYMNDNMPANEVAGSGLDAAGWIKSGDLAVMDPAGYIRIVGRVKEMIIRGGENLFPAEIERHLQAHPAVGTAAVIGLPDEKYGEELCAVLLLKQSAIVTEDEIRAWCDAHLSRWKVPRYIAFTGEFPLTLSGKIQKHKLKEQMQRHFGIGHSGV